MSQMTHSCVWNSSLQWVPYVTWLCKCKMTLAYLYDASLYVWDRFPSKCYTPKIHQIEKFKFSVQFEIKPKSQFKFVPRDTKKSEFLDVVDFWGVAFSVEPDIASYTVILHYMKYSFIKMCNAHMILRIWLYNDTCWCILQMHIMWHDFTIMTRFATYVTWLYNNA